MSVINQMLKDLEQRRAQGFDNNADMLDDLGVGTNNGGEATKKSRSNLWLLFILILCVVAAFSFILWKISHKQAPVIAAIEGPAVIELKAASKPTLVVENKQPVLSPVIPEPTEPELEKRVIEPKETFPAEVNETETKAVDPIFEAPVVKTKETVSSGADEPVTNTAGETEPLVSDNEEMLVDYISPAPLVANGKREIITVRGSGFNEPLLVMLEWDGGRAFKELEPWQVNVVSNKEIQLRVNLGTLADDWRMIISQVEGNRRAEYDFSVNAQAKTVVDAVNNTAPATPVSVFNKKVTPLTIDEQVALIYVEANNSLQQGKINNAIELLQKVLAFDSFHIQARETLATLLIKQQKYDQAISVLEQGRIKHPEHASFVLLLARIHTERGQDPLAIVLLEEINPDVASNSDYYALLAALYQRGAQYKKAALVYEKLLSVYPGKAVWWMGLGLSLQTTERKQDALSAYKKALVSQGLNPDLKRFIQTRISTLQQP